MLFNSLEFLTFFPITCLVYFMLPYRWRWAWLLCASYFFYAAWEPRYLILIWISTAVDYCAGLAMGRWTSRRSRLLCLFASLGCNLGLLLAFKYFDFFSQSIRGVAAAFGFEYHPGSLNVLLPVGISFYTFQTLSYTIEVYRGTHKPERHPGIFALYVAFFPQLVAGPIERSKAFLPQLKRDFDFDYARIVSGVRMMLWGMFKKVVVADRLAICVDTVYENPDQAPPLALVVATVFFAFQIYCDFSGYSDIAIGAARIMGFRLMTNFQRPYFAPSISEFWHRWHISLSTWFRDYVYLPLGGGRVSVPRYYGNILIVFVVSGLWHGANWTFVVWGALHASYYMMSRLTKGIRAKCVVRLGLNRVPLIHRSLQMAFTFVLVCIGWVFFRAESVGQAWGILATIWQGRAELFAIENPQSFVGALGIDLPRLWLTLGVLGILLAFEMSWELRGEDAYSLGGRYAPLRWAVYLFLSLAVMNLGVRNEIPFIYFQF